MGVANAGQLGLIGLLVTGCADVAPASVASQLFISDYRANAIFRYDGDSGGFLGVFAEGSEQRVDRPAGVRFGPRDQLYAAGFGRGEIVRYDVHSGAMMDVFYWDTALLEEPVELAFHGDELVVLGNDTQNIVVLAPDGRAMRSFGYPIMQGAHDFAFGGADRVYVATDTAIQIWNLATGTQLGQLGTPDQLARATSVAVDRDETIFVADWERGRVVRYAADGSWLGILADGFVGPIAIELGLDGALYVLDRTGVVRLDAADGDNRSQLVAGDQLVSPRGFTFVSDALLGLE
ncbi:MAG: hypothetical protein H0T89_20435 [Deltaproteobacteria bacterium]|nr:hypothetical protein [Deltaproteobacteria bacterium]MDQ3297159.1 hypothetical protein [Myxococcota bacterium]